MLGAKGKLCRQKATVYTRICLLFFCVPDIFNIPPVDIPRQRIYNLFMYKTEDFKWIKK